MTTLIPPSPGKTSVRRRSPGPGWPGLIFVVLLLLSAGMASVPAGSDRLPTIRRFYAAHGPVVVVAQLIGLVAAAAFAVHARALANVTPSRLSRPVRAAGTVVAGSAALTAMPVLVLAATLDRDSDRVIVALARASDWTDVVLFTAVSLFAAAVARASNRRWVCAMAGSVALLSAARSVLLAWGSSALNVAAPVGFLALVTLLSVRDLGHKPL